MTTKLLKLCAQVWEQILAKVWRVSSKVSPQMSERTENDSLFEQCSSPSSVKTKFGLSNDVPSGVGSVCPAPF